MFKTSRGSAPSQRHPDAFATSAVTVVPGLPLARSAAAVVELEIPELAVTVAAPEAPPAVIPAPTLVGAPAVVAAPMPSAAPVASPAAIQVAAQMAAPAAAPPAPVEAPVQRTMPPAGWYVDPGGHPGAQRYWDGENWTEHLA